MTGKIIVAGIGPGAEGDISGAVLQACSQADVVVSYSYYMQFIRHLIREDAILVDTGMKQEVQRAEEAFNYAETGKLVCVISSGDAGIYGMAPLVWEMKSKRHSNVEIEVLPGISAFQKAAAVLGAPIGHDLCLISLSDLMTPWAVIERRIEAAAYGDFITAVYNPKSRERYWQLARLIEIFLRHRSPDTVMGIVRQAGRPEQEAQIFTLETFDIEVVDMFTVVIIGNSRTFLSEDNKMITPRGYYTKYPIQETENMGQNIMIESFRTIESELRNPNIPIGKKWPLLHAIHTTADFDMENIVRVDDHAVETMYKGIVDGKVDTIVTDVSMVAAGIRKGALERLGVKVICYLNDEGCRERAKELGITRSQMGIRKAVEEHPNAIFAFGNAPTALIELTCLIRRGQAQPSGIIAAPVGFVHVCESKHMVKPFKNIPKIIVEGRKGGSNLAATLINSILCFDDAEQLKPGRDV